jgi:hypothetical protein
MALLERTRFGVDNGEGYLGAIREVIDWRILQAVITLAGDPAANEMVREDSYGALEALAGRLDRSARRGNVKARSARIEIRRFFEHLADTPRPEPEAIPPGAPIG